MKQKTILLSLVVVSITLIGFLIIPPTTNTPLTVTDSGKSTSHLVYPTVSFVAKSKQVISNVKSYKSNQITQFIQNANSKPQNIWAYAELLLGLVQKAEAISSTQSTITVTSVSIPPFSDTFGELSSSLVSVDSSGNTWGVCFILSSS